MGAKEIEQGVMSVRTRDGAQRKMTAEKLSAELEGQIKGKPFLGLPLPKRLSRRPIFVG
jgi:threonyl-tRNA synthetase